MPFCAKFDDNRTFTQAGFLSRTDEENKGNLPIAKTLDKGPKDVDAYWTSSYQKLYGQPWKPLAGGTKTFTDREPAAVRRAAGARRAVLRRRRHGLLRHRRAAKVYQQAKATSGDLDGRHRVRPGGPAAARRVARDRQ